MSAGTLALARSGDAALAAIGILVEQIGKLADNRPAKLVDIGDGDGAPVIAGDIMADADGEKLHWRA